MADIVFESLRALVLLGILIFFVRADTMISHGRKGWLYIQIGFLLVLFGAFVDILDNFDYFRPTITIASIPVFVFLKKGVGYTGGAVMLAIGFRLWLPSMQRVDELRRELKEVKRSLDYKVMERTQTLEKDFDSRMKYEAALRQTEEHRQHLYENAPIGISHGLIGGTLVARNAAFARMLGYQTPAELEEAIEESGDLAFFWHDKDDFQVMIERLRTEKFIPDFETRFDHKDGSLVWVRMTFTALEDRKGNHYYFYSFVDDISEDKEAAQILAESEARLKAIIDFLPSGVIMVDTETQDIAEVNPAALKMLGYAREDIIGKHCCTYLCPRKRGSCPILDQGKKILNREVKLRCKDGTLMPVMKSAARFVMGDQEYLLETFVDLSESKRLEQLKEDIDFIVRHDLKSPVVSMINASSVLLMEDSLPDETREILELIQKQGNKVLRLAGMSLAMYKMEGGSYDYTPESVDLAAVLRRVQRELAEKAQNAMVDLRVEFGGTDLAPDATIFVSGDELLCESMLANLVDNAIDASPERGVVTVSLNDGDNPTVSVTNQGVVPDAIRSTFFEKFVTAGKKNGTGLGTYSASMSARTMGADIAMDTSDEEGRTTLTVSFSGSQG